MDSEDYDDIFAHARAQRTGYAEVYMDAASIVVVAEGQPGYIATRRLGGCSGIVILGRTAAIMAHIAPRSSGAPRVTSVSVQHFATILHHVERLYTTHRQHFPAEATAWGFYMAGLPLVTDDLKALATARLAAIGLVNRHTYYHPVFGPNRGDEVRACVRISGDGNTLFFIEQRTIDRISFPEPLPSRSAIPGVRNFLVWNDDLGRLVHMVNGRRAEPDFQRLSGVYDVLHIDTAGAEVWMRFDFDSKTWYQKT